jgi:hypothetical protein
MSILIHFLTSLLLALILSIFYGWYSLWAFVGGVLVDVDHYLLYVSKFRNINLKKIYHYYAVEGCYFKGMYCVFHSFELILLLGALSFFSEIVLIITIGLFLHYVLDIIFELKYCGKTIKNWSFILFVRNTYFGTSFDKKPSPK